MVVIKVKSGFTGRVYDITAPDETMAAEWLFAMVKAIHPPKPGVSFGPTMTIEHFQEWSSDRP